MTAVTETVTPAPAALLLAVAILAGCGMAPGRGAPEETAAVRAVEEAFAGTMATRNFEGFARHVAEEAVFINGGEPLRGRPAILAHWSRFFSSPQAPFSWAPDIVEVLPSGALAYTEGPVQAPDGAHIGRFYSVWRRDPRGEWRIVFDNGYELCR